MAGWLMYSMLRGFFQFMIAIGWWRWRVEGLENLPPRHQSGMIIAMNHVHWVDILAVGTLLPFQYRLSWLGKAELFQHWLARWYFQNMKVIPVQRGKRDLSAITIAEDALRQGAALLIFPEGHRSGTGILQPGQSGVIRLATRSDVPIVPIAITGTQHGLWGTLQRKEVVLRIGMPYTIMPDSNGKIRPATMKWFISDLMHRIASMLPPEYQGAYQLATASPTPNMRYNRE